MTSALANNLHRHSEILWQGQVTVDRVAELRDELLTTLLQSQSVAIDLADVTALDLSALQLLCSAQRAAIPQGKAIQLQEQDGEVVSATLTRLGYRRLAPCCRDCGDHCLWLDGGTP